MGLLVFAFQSYINSVIDGKEPAQALISDLEKNMKKWTWPDEDKKAFLDFTREALSCPGASQFIKNLSKDSKLVDALLDCIKPKNGFQDIQGITDNSFELFIKLAKNLGKDGYEPLNKALADPKQREALLKALRGGDQEQLLAFTRGEAPIQLASAKNEGGMINLETHFKIANLGILTTGEPTVDKGVNNFKPNNLPSMA
jgi:hypothetical protein